jgi:hypothetical protein
MSDVPAILFCNRKICSSCKKPFSDGTVFVESDDLYFKSILGSTRVPVIGHNGKLGLNKPQSLIVRNGLKAHCSCGAERSVGVSKRNTN